MTKIKFFKNKYEREAFLKAFFIYFLSINLLISFIFYFHYKNLILEQKNLLFLEMKNFSLSFEGKKFKLDLVSVKKNKKFPVYELLENEKEFYMYIPIPDVKTEILKIVYPKDKFYLEFSNKIKKVYFTYALSILFSLILSLLFAVYTTKPLRKAIDILNETIKDIIHDINTPVMSIIVNLRLLRMKYQDDEDVSRLELAVKQLSSIYKNLKTALEETKKANDEINLKQVIEEELKTLKSLFPDLMVNVSLENKVIHANKEAVERIIFNLLSNAFKHNVKNGFVNVSLKDNKLIVENSSQKIKNPKRLFDRYYKESQRGIGLGLSIVKKLVEELGWSIEIKVEKDRFKVILLIR